MNPIMSLYQAMRNPNQFMQNMLNNNKVTGNPMAMNALDMMKNGDNEGIEKMARNLCKSSGLDPDEIYKKVKAQIGAR